MSCTVAISNSPVFSPSRVPSSLFCKSSLSSSSSPNKSSLTRNHSPSSSSLSSSPLRFRPPSGLNRACWDAGVGSTSPTVLKRKRTARHNIPVMSGWGGGLETSAAVERKEEVEVEREGWYSVYCKRARREAMEDRYFAVVNLKGDWFERSQ